jgi:beta-galactosidase
LCGTWQVGGAHFLAEKVLDAPDGAPQEHPIPDQPEPAIEAEVPVEVQYTVYGDGSVRMDWRIDATRALPARLAPPLFPCVLPNAIITDTAQPCLCHSPLHTECAIQICDLLCIDLLLKLSSGASRSLPRVGIHIGIPADFSRVHWYGRGPHESYPDRKFGAFLRQHFVDDVSELHVPYIFPSLSTPEVLHNLLCLCSE